MSSSKKQFQPGDIIHGRYKISEEIGSGGFATTYKAQDLSLGIPVALKVYHRSSFTGQKEATKEAKIAAGLYDLEGIAAARDFFDEDDTPCIVMEYVKGTSIKDYIHQHGRIAGDKTLLLVKPLLKSLIKIHEKGILHRDISADNILLTEDGKLKLIDFGAARFTQKARGEEYTLIFKRGFAPIEQCSNAGEQGPWTDVYGICATMYYMVTGIIPDDSVNRFMDDKLLPLERIDGTKLSRHAIACITKGLSVRIEDRYPSVALLYADLYRNDISDTESSPSVHSTIVPAVSDPTETDFTEKLMEDIAHSMKKGHFLFRHRKAAISLLLCVLLALGIAVYYYHAAPAGTSGPDSLSEAAFSHSPAPDSLSGTAFSNSPVPDSLSGTAFSHSLVPDNRRDSASVHTRTTDNPPKVTFTPSPGKQQKAASTRKKSSTQKSSSQKGNTTTQKSSSSNSRSSAQKNALSKNNSTRKNSSSQKKSSSGKNTQHFDGDLDGL